MQQQEGIDPTYQHYNYTIDFTRLLIECYQIRLIKELGC